MAQQLIMKSRSLGKDEVLSLLDLISKHNIIMSKLTNATINRLKEEAWESIAQEFSAMVGEIKRPEQLRLKWENLKKSARKRNKLIRQNFTKKGGRKTYIPPDKALDRVASMLGPLRSRFTVEPGSDREELVSPVASEIQSLEISDSPPLLEPHQDENVVAGSSDLETFENKRQKLSEELQRAQCDKEQAIAALYRAKTEKVKLKTLKLKLEIEKLRNSVK